MKVTAQNGQTITDIALQVYGSAEGAYTLASENGMHITDMLTAGTELNYSSANVIDRRIVDYYKANQVFPISGYKIDVIRRTFDQTFDLSFL
nr:hypothetical protein [uncultured Bacteroides sp.]